MGDSWQIEASHDAHWLVTPRGMAGADLAKGHLLPARVAAVMLDDWFPEGPFEALRTSLLADIVFALEPMLEARGPLGVPRMKALLREALFDGRVTCVRIKATTSAGRRVELDLPEEPKPPEQVSHWVEFEIKDQRGNLVSGLKYTLLLVGAGPEEGTLAEGNVYKTGVKKGTHRLQVKQLWNARWNEPAVLEIKEDEIEKDYKEIILVAEVRGFAEKTTGEIKVYDASDVGGTVVATVATEVQAGEQQISGKWKPKRDELITAKTGQLVFVATVTGGGVLRATSGAIPAKVKHTITVKNQGGDVPNDTQVSGAFANGATFVGPTKDGKVEVSGPAGVALAWVGLPGKEGIPVKFKREDGRERTFVTPERPKQ